MFHLGPHRRLCLLRQRLLTLRVQFPPVARTHGHLPLYFQPLILLPFVHTLIPSVPPNHSLTAVQLVVGLDNVVGVGRRRAHAVHYPCFRVHPNVRLHPEMLLGPLPGLMHLRVPFPGPVLDGRRCLDDGGVHDGPSLNLRPWDSRWALISSKSPRSRLCLPNIWRKFSIVISSGKAPDSFRPTNRLTGSDS